MTQLSQRVQRIKPSATVMLNNRTKELIAQGKNIIALNIGEPDFDTPEHIKAAAIEAIRAGQTKYTQVDGTPALKKAIIEKFRRENNLTYEAKQVIVSNGAKHSIFNLLQALINIGDEVIIPAPYWVSYPDMVAMCDGTPVIVTAGIEQDFKINPQQLEQAITPRTKLLFLNSPSNPTGVAYTKAELAALGEVLLRHTQVYILTDDIYEHVLWSEEGFQNIVNACPELYSRTIVVNGVSKSYSMTGWRIGYAAGPADIIQAMVTLQSQNTSNPCSISQAASVAALTGDQSCLKPMVQAFKERHDYLAQALNTLPGFQCRVGEGAFYLFPNVEKAIANLGLQDDFQFAEFLLTEALVSVVPGTPFGAPGCIRLSYATSMEVLQEAVARIDSALKL